MSAVTMEENALDALHGFAQRYPRLLVLSGAGLSTASGIPDYRDADGTRRGSQPVMLQDFLASAATRQRYWARSMAGWPTIEKAVPNAGHQAIAALEAAGLISGLVTQNVDALHRRAGSLDAIELHGCIHDVVCLDCGLRTPREAVQSMLEADNPHLAHMRAAPAPDGDAHVGARHIEDFNVPRCPACGAQSLKPDVVFFGEGVPRPRAAAATQCVHDAAAVLVIGSSLMAFSGFRLCRLAAELGKPVAAINIGMTRADHLLTLKVAQACGQVLPALAARFASRSL